jgi:hypothetical protein
MDDIQAILALLSAFLGIILLFLKIVNAPVPPWVKKTLSNPVIRIVIAALILFGVCLFICPPQRRPVVAIKTAHNRYVTAMGADRDWVLRAKTDEILEFEEFTLLCREKGKVAVQTWHKIEQGKNRYVTAMDDQWHGDEEWYWVLRAETDEILDFEEFTLLDADTGNRRSCSEAVKSLKDSSKTRVAFQTWHQKEDRHRLVTAMDDTWTEIEESHWVLRAETNVLEASEKFAIELLRWEWKINIAAYTFVIGGSLLILSVFLFIYRRKART